METKLAAPLHPAVCPSNHSYADGRYHLGGTPLNSAGMIRHLSGWLDRYSIVSIEDRLAEEDWVNWSNWSNIAPSHWRAQVLGNDFPCTNPAVSVGPWTRARPMLCYGS